MLDLEQHQECDPRAGLVKYIYIYANSPPKTECPGRHYRSPLMRRSIPQGAFLPPLVTLTYHRLFGFVRTCRWPVRARVLPRVERTGVAERMANDVAPPEGRIGAATVDALAMFGRRRQLRLVRIVQRADLPVLPIAADVLAEIAARIIHHDRRGRVLAWR